MRGKCLLCLLTDLESELAEVKVIAEASQLIKEVNRAEEEDSKERVDIDEVHYYHSHNH